jgi:hypothetical protein
MDPDLKFVLGVALVVGAVVGLVLALLVPLPITEIIAAPDRDPAAYEVAGVLEEARRIAKEAADDAR